MTDLMRWNPFREMISLRDAMNRLFDESFVQPLARWPEIEGQRGQALALDLEETDNDLVVTTTLPGVKAEDVDISVRDNVLSIRAETSRETKEGQEGKYYLKERFYGAFQRAITLPVAVNPDKAEARFEDGVLTLTLPKAEEAKPRRIAVK